MPRNHSQRHSYFSLTKHLSVECRLSTSFFYPDKRRGRPQNLLSSTGLLYLSIQASDETLPTSDQWDLGRDQTDDSRPSDHFWSLEKKKKNHP